MAALVGLIRTEQPAARRASPRDVRAALAGGVIGGLREIHSDFHFKVARPDNIRMFADLAGGALNDFGCYPIRLAFELFGDAHLSTWGSGVPGGHGVDLESTAILSYGQGRTLFLSCGMNRRYDTFTRLLGSDGEIRMSNPFHPSDGDRLEILSRQIESATAAAPPGEPSFSAAIRHIQAVLGGVEESRHLAIDTSPTAQALTTCTPTCARSRLAHRGQESPPHAVSGKSTRSCRAAMSYKYSYRCAHLASSQHR
jgi:predicted dehydrogenase